VGDRSNAVTRESAPAGPAASAAGRAAETDAWLAQALVRQAPEAIVVTDPEGIIRVWNGGAERVFGYPAAEAVGRSLDLIIPEKLRDRHWAGYRKTMATGCTRYGDTLLKVPATHRDGRRLSIEFSVALLRDEADGIVAISAIIRDATDRWNAEKALRARLAELERRAGAPPEAPAGAPMADGKG
jgi:PAS domain S-box-containing protein